MIEQADEIESTAEVEQADQDTELNDSGEESHDADESSDHGLPAEDDEVVVSIGGESPPQDEIKRAPEWVRELRKADREKSRKIKELEAKLSAAAPTENKPVELGPKPSLAGFDFDEEKYEAALEDWHARKRKIAAEVEAQELAKRKQQQEWEQRVIAYNASKEALKVRDYDEAEFNVQEILDVTQQGIIMHAASNPALIVYALGKNPKRAKELAAITDPVRFAVAIGEMQKADITMTTRKAAPPPEKTVESGGKKTGAADSTLERLREKAEKTGDYTEVVRYRRSLAEKRKN